MWLAAMSIELWVSGESVDVSPEANIGNAVLARRRLSFAASASLCSLCLWMLAFYNWYMYARFTGRAALV